MADRNEFAPEEREPDIEEYNVAPADMPPSPAGADVEIGGEAAASRRQAGIPDRLQEEPIHRSGEATPGAEPMLGYDGLATEDILDWIRDADPDLEQLRAIHDYEAAHRERAPVLRECQERIDRFEAPPMS